MHLFTPCHPVCASLWSAFHSSLCCCFFFHHFTKFIDRMTGIRVNNYLQKLKRPVGFVSRRCADRLMRWLLVTHHKTLVHFIRCRSTNRAQVPRHPSPGTLLHSICRVRMTSDNALDILLLLLGRRARPFRYTFGVWNVYVLVKQRIAILKCTYTYVFMDHIKE